MNWKEIKEKYPEAYQKFMRWKWDFKGNPPIEPRWLYDFFDEQKIKIVVVTVMNVDEWSYTILSDKTYNGNKLFGFRTEAEESAFKKAFEILENQLK